MLPQAGALGFSVETVARLSEALAHLRDNSIDIILLDLGLPDSNGLDTLRAVRREARESAIVVLTGREDEQLGLAAILEGAQDYVPKGQVTGVLLARILRHAYERQQTARSLRRSEQLLRATLDALSSNIAIVDAAGTILEVNLAWREFAVRNGASVGAVSDGVNYLDACVDTEQGVEFAFGMQAVLSGAKDVFEMEYPCHSPDQQRWFRGTVTRFHAEGPPRVVVAHENITERMQAREELRESGLRFRTIFDQVTDGILLADRATRAFVMVNRAACEMLGYAEEELLRLSVKDIHPAAALSAVEARFDARIPGVLPLSQDVPVRRKDGTVFFADIKSVSVTLDGRALLMGNFRDVTERRTLQASMAQADRLASMGMLAAGIAHEINNPLAYVLYNVESLAESLPTLAKEISKVAETFQPEFDETITSVRDAVAGARRIRAISRGLGTFSRVETVELSEVNLNDAIECAVNMVRNEVKYRAQLVSELGPLPTLWASEGKLSQVFLNLLLNAAHSIEEGHVQSNRITVRTWSEADDVLAEVADTGEGISPENLERIFEPFFTTKMAGVGSGLGLAICKNIITSFGGSIRVESDRAAGTRFVIRLPAAHGAAQQRNDDASVSTTQGADMHGRILIVDDEEPICRTLQRILGRDHEVIVATSGEQARALLETHRRFDVILCDLMMPGISGMDLHAWLLGFEPSQADRMVFMTGGTFTPKGEKFLSEVCNSRLEKPMSLDAVREVVKEHLSRTSPGRSSGSNGGQECP